VGKFLNFKPFVIYIIIIYSIGFCLESSIFSFIEVNVFIKINLPVKLNKENF